MANLSLAVGGDKLTFSVESIAEIQRRREPRMSAVGMMLSRQPLQRLRRSVASTLFPEPGQPPPRHIGRCVASAGACAVGAQLLVIHAEGR